MTAKRMPYATQEMLDRYPGAGMTDEQKEMMDQRRGTIEDLVENPGLLIYNLRQQTSQVYSVVFEKLAEVTDEATALKVAYDYGYQRGVRNYSRFLTSHGYDGGPEAFCEYQDYGHAMYGNPGALWAEYDEEAGVVIVRRSECHTFWGERGTPNKFTRAIEEGVARGQMDVDPYYMAIENPKCISKGDVDGCEHHCIFSRTPISTTVWAQAGPKVDREDGSTR